MEPQAGAGLLQAPIADPTRAGLGPPAASQAGAAAGCLDGVGCVPVSLTDEWTPEEEKILAEELASVPADTPPTERYVMVAARLPRKTTRQTATRAVQMARLDRGKRRKAGDGDAAPKRQCRDPAPRAGGGGGRCPGGGAVLGLGRLGCSLPPVGPISEANRGVGAAISRLLAANTRFLDRVRANLGTCRVAENNELLSRLRDNLAEIVGHMDGMRGVMGKMPQLCVAVDGVLADSVLAKPAPDSAFAPFPGGAAAGLPMSPPAASPIAPMPFFPELTPCMADGGLSVDVPGGLPAMSLAQSPGLHSGINTPLRPEMVQEPTMQSNPFQQLGVLPGSPEMESLMMGSLGPGMQVGQQGLGLGMGQQVGPPLARAASASVLPCLPQGQDDALGLDNLLLSEAWSTGDLQWGSKAATKWEASAGLLGPVQAALTPIAPSAARLAAGAVDMVASASPLARQGLHGGLLQAGSKEPGVVQGALG